MIMTGKRKQPPAVTDHLQLLSDADANDDLRSAGYTGPGWYFWDEVDANCLGPYASVAEARTALDAYASELNAPPLQEPVPEKTPRRSAMEQSDRLKELLKARFYNNWPENISLSVPADQLYWLVNLAEVGLATCNARFQDQGELDAGAIASLVSWDADIRALVDQVEQALKS